MKKLILLPLLLMMAGVSVFGQVFIGPKAGVTFSNYGLSSDDKDVYNSNLNLGFLGGVTFEIPFSSRFGMQAEVYFSQKGAIFRRNENESNTTRYPFKCVHEKLNYVEVPILFRYRFQGRPLGGFISTGGALARTFGGKRIEGSKEKGTKRTIEVGSGANDDYKATDIGFVIGGGLSYELGFGELIFDARYILGLVKMGEVTNDNPDYLYGNGTNRSIQLSLGIIFPIGG
ncbi:MAG: PorT family protein [Lewinellaceae bacterium]|nr:PorT family protein [Saprospiraceae bacterium]MCB9338316.1 PorT family protein [Lewinellaceae bacterium]